MIEKRVIIRGLGCAPIGTFFFGLKWVFDLVSSCSMKFHKLCH